jgi:HSP20 family molecular chaperone IbpA
MLTRFTTQPSLIDLFFGDHDTGLFPLFEAPRYHQVAPLTAASNNDALTFELNVPRFKQADIQVKADETSGQVTITGKRAARAGETGEATQSFERSFAVSPKQFDLKKVESSVEDGVLTVRVPRKPVENRALATTTNTNTAAIPWPPRFESKNDDNGLVLHCKLPDEVKRDDIHVKLLDGGRLQVQASYCIKTETEHSRSEHSASFSRVLSVPEGTRAEDISFDFQPGDLTVRVKSAAAPKAK